MNMTVTEGNGIINGRPVKKGDHFILPDGFGMAGKHADHRIYNLTGNESDAVYQEKKIYSVFLSYDFFGNSIRVECDESSTSFWLFTNSQVASP